MKEFIKNKLNESVIFELIQNMLDEDYPSSFNMDDFKSLKRFSERVNYCEEHLKRISSGSSRIVYMIDNTKVLKLAKNKKGVAQCETEIEWGQSSYYESILAHTLDYHPDGLWNEMELAVKIKKSDFPRLLGFDFDTYGKYLINFYDENRGRRSLYNIEPKYKTILDKSDFVNTVASFMHDTDSPAGDLARLNSYGLVKRDGVDSIVIIDFGLTGEIYTTYYDHSIKY